MEDWTIVLWTNKIQTIWHEHWIFHDKLRDLLVKKLHDNFYMWPVGKQKVFVINHLKNLITRPIIYWQHELVLSVFYGVWMVYTSLKPNCDFLQQKRSMVQCWIFCSVLEFKNMLEKTEGSDVQQIPRDEEGKKLPPHCRWPVTYTVTSQYKRVTFLNY